MGTFSLSGGVEVTGFISPTDPLDTYPVIDTFYGIDGLRNVDTESDLNNIPNLRRRAGMLAGVSGGTKYYRLKPSPWSGTISDWEEFKSGGIEFGSNLGGGNEVFKEITGDTIYFRTLSGGSNTTLTTIGDTIRIDVTIPPDTNTYVTGGTYNDVTDTITLTRNDNVTIEITGVTDYYTSGGTYNISTQSIDFSGNSIETTFTVDLSTLVSSVSANTFVTGTTFSSNEAILTRNDDFEVLKLSGGSNVTLSNPSLNQILIDVTIPPDTNTYVTGGTYNDLTDTITLTRNDNVTIEITGVTDTFTTGGTYSNSTKLITFTRNDGNIYSVDLSTLDINDTYVTGFTYDNVNTFTITRNDDVSISTSISTLSGITYYGNGIGLTNIPISGVTNLQTELDNKVNQSLFNTYTGDTQIILNTKISGATNLASEGVFAQKNGFDLEFKGLTSTGSTLNITSDSSTVNLDVVFPTDVFVYSGNADVISSTLSFLNTTGGTFTVTNSAALFSDNDINVTGGTYNPSDGCITFTTNSGTSFNVCGFLTGYTNYYVTGGTYNDVTDTITLTRNDGGTVEITGVTDTFTTGGTYSNGTATFTNNSGGTFFVSGFTEPFSGGSGNCITDFYVTNIHGCSPITIHDSVRSDNSIVLDDSYSYAFGNNVISTGGTSHAEGSGTTASGTYSHAEGWGNIASGSASHAEGGDSGEGPAPNTASGISSHAEGADTIASGRWSHAEGFSTTASDDYAHAEGRSSTASGFVSHAEGSSTTALGDYSHAEGRNTMASGSTSHAEGRSTTASGTYSHAEGYLTISSGESSHSEGESTTASGLTSHAEGYLTIAGGENSHAQNNRTEAIGSNTHAGGQGGSSTEKVIAKGDVSFVHFYNNSGSNKGAYGDHSAILGGQNHNIGTGSTSSAIFAGNNNVVIDDVLRSVVLGGQGLTATTNDTVFVPALNINSIGSGSPIINLGLDVNGFVVTGTTSPQDIFVTGFTYDNVNTFTISRNDNVSLTSTISTLSGITYYGDGSGLFNIPISGVTNLQTTLDTKISGATNLSSEGIFAQINGFDLEFKGITSTGGTLSITSDNNTVNLETILPQDVFVYSGNANVSNSTLSFLNTTGGTFTVTNSAALFADNDINVTGGTYNPSTGCVTFTTNSGTSFNVCGFLTGVTDTYVTGTTFNANEAVLTRTDGFDVFKLSGGTGVSLSNPSTNQILIDVSIPPSSNTYVTGGTYNDVTNTITLTRNDDVQINITGVTDSYVTGVTLNGTTLELERNEGLPTLSVNLSSIDTNYYVTGGTYNSGTTSIDYVGTTGFPPFSVNLSELISGVTLLDKYTTGATLVNDLLVFDRTDQLSAYTVSLTSLVVTGTTYREIFLNDETFTTNSAGRSVLTSTSTGFLSFAGTGQPDDAGVSFKIPLDYDSEPQFAVQWTMDGTSSTANTVNYNLNITTGNTSTINEHSVISETISIVDEAYSGTAWRILQTSFSSSTLNYTAGDYIHVELERDPANVNDTMIETAFVSGLIFKYKANK